MNRTIRRSAGAGLLALALAPPAWAAPPLTLSLGVQPNYFSRRAYDLVDTNDHLPMLRMGVGYTRSLSAGAIDVELGYGLGRTEAELHQDFASRFRLQGLQLAATYRHALHPRLEPFVQLHGGWEWAKLKLEGLGERLSQTDGGFTAGGMLGVSIPLLRRERPGRDASRFSLELGVGYTSRPSYAFEDLRPDRKDDETANEDEAIPPGGVSLGKLPLSAPHYRIGFTVRL